MKTMWKITRTELQLLFYSPVAWLVFALFMLQAGISLMSLFQECIMDYPVPKFRAAWGDIMNGIFLKPPKNLVGFFPQMQDYLYLYIPLLTMGLISRELEDGSIKLLYSSPVTNFQLVVGKYLSVMLYALGLIGMLFILCLFACFSIENFDFSQVLVGLLGFYLLIGAYAAIGIFVSSLIPNQTSVVVATLGIFFLLNIAGQTQGRKAPEGISRWLAIDERIGTFEQGAIFSDDLFYFLIIIALFLGITILRLQTVRYKFPFVRQLKRYVIFVGGAILLSMLTSMPALMFHCYLGHTSLNRKVLAKQDVIGFVQGHEERSFKRENARSLKEMAETLSFLKMGKLEGISLKREVPEEVRFLFLADPQELLSERERQRLMAYVERGGHLCVLGEPGFQAKLNPLLEPFGVEFLPGRLVQEKDTQADKLLVKLSPEAQRLLKIGVESPIVVLGSMGVKYTSDKGFTVTPLWVSDSSVWNEVETTDFEKERVRFQPAAGERKQIYPVGVALSRVLEGREQRIVVLGDVDCFSNNEYERVRKEIGGSASNRGGVYQLWKWFIGNDRFVKAPVKTAPKPSASTDLDINLKQLYPWKIIFIGVLPGLFALFALFIWIRRKGR